MTEQDVFRLTSALEELILSESLALRSENIFAAVRAQSRAAPIIVALAEADRAGLIPDELRGRLRAVAERRQQSRMCLAEMKSRRWPQIEHLRTTQRRLTGTMRAYARRKPKSTFIVRG